MYCVEHTNLDIPLEFSCQNIYKYFLDTGNLH